MAVVSWLLLLTVLPAATQPLGNRQAVIEGLRVELKKARPDTAAVRLHIRLSEALLTLDPVAAGRAADDALRLARRLRDVRGQGLAEDMIGNSLNFQGQYKEALAHLTRARRLLEQAGPTRANRLALTDTWNSIGISYDELADFPASTAAYLQSLRLAELLGDSIPIAKANVNLGGLAARLKQSDEAALRYRRALPMVRIAGPRVIILNNLAAVFIDRRNPDSAAAYLERARRELHNVDSERLTAEVAYSTGRVWRLRGQPDSAIVSYRRALAVAEPLHQPDLLLGPLLELGELLVGRDPHDPTAAALLTRALTLAQQTEAPDRAREAHRSLAIATAARGQTADALRHREAELALTDSIFAQDAAARVAGLKMRYEVEKREQQARIQALELRETDAKLQRRTIGLAALGAALLAVLGAGAWLLTRARLNARLAVADERAAQQRARATAVLEAEERERRRIGADLHDSVGQLLAAAKLNLSALQHDLSAPPADHDRLRTALDTLDEGLREVRTLSHQLVPNALLRHGLSGAVRELIGRVAGPAGLHIHLDVLGMERGLPPALESMLYRTIQEVIANVVKHARATEVTIQLLHQGAEATVLIEDNGVGFDPTTLATRPDAGIGLRNLAARVEYVGGRFTLDARPGRGTIVSVEVPVEVAPAPAEPVVA